MNNTEEIILLYSSRHDKPLKLLIRVVQVTPQTLQPMAAVLGCLSEIAGKAVFLKTLNTSDTGLKRFELDLTWKSLYWHLDFIVPSSI